MKDHAVNLSQAREHLLNRGYRFSEGLSNREVHEIEQRFQFLFPEDLRDFLQGALPVGDGFPDWRGSDSQIWDKLRRPEEGLCFDIRNHVFCFEDWGIRPQSDEQALSIAQDRLRALPPLIPVHGHSYLPSEPQAAGNPVFSIHQADVIHRGRNLAEFLLWLRHDEDTDEIEDRYPV